MSEKAGGLRPADDVEEILYVVVVTDSEGNEWDEACTIWATDEQDALDQCAYELPDSTFRIIGTIFPEVESRL